MRIPGRLTASVMTVLVAAGALAACDPQGQEQAPEGSESESESESSDDGDADSGEQATLSPEFLECGSPQDLDEDDGLMLAEVDLTAATWATPEGFRETSRYFEDNPVENLVTLWVAEPAADPVRLNVVNTVLYDGLDWGDAADPCGRVPIEAVEERLAGYRDQIGATPIDDAEMLLVDGHPAITQRIELTEYSYVGYWLFSPTQLLHVYCQWTTNPGQQDQIEAACSELIDSVSVG